MEKQYCGIYGALLQEYNVARVREIGRRRTARLEKLKSRADAEAYIREVREKIAASFALPERPADLHAEVVGVEDAPDCRIEKIVYESRPAFPVTALLFLPKAVPAPLPAVLFLCGHAADGKHCITYQTGARALAARGFAVLMVDPIAQGERYQFLGVNNAAGIDGSCTAEHNMLGKQMWLCGEFFGSWRAHDALCGLDYLLSRPEVDASRVGVTGNSGGGTMTTFVQALDPRFTMAAPSCYVTSWQRNIENELPADVEQIPPGILAAGCEMGDFVLAYAPRPILLLGQRNDFFDPRGLRETFEACRKVYALLGAEDHLRLFIGPRDHGYFAENRRSMYDFFCSCAGLPPVEKEPVISPAEREKTLCTPSGQTVDLPGKKSVRDLISEELDRLAAARPALTLPQLREVLIGRLGFPASAPVPYCRTLRNGVGAQNRPDRCFFSRFGLETEPGILTVLTVKEGGDLPQSFFFHFPEREEITLYVPHLSAAAELAEMELSRLTVGVDVRGIGAGMPYTCDFRDEEFFHGYGRDYHYNSCAIMFGSSLLAERMRDLLGAVAYIRAQGVRKIRIAGRGQGAVAALFAAVLDEKIASVRLMDAPRSFDAMARARVTLWPHAVMPGGILRYTDLPSIYEALKAEGRLEEISFTGDFFRPGL